MFNLQQWARLAVSVRPPDGGVQTGTVTQVVSYLWDSGNIGHRSRFALPTMLNTKFVVLGKTILESMRCTPLPLAEARDCSRVGEFQWTQISVPGLLWKWYSI